MTKKTIVRTPNISVLGSYTATEDELNLSYELGKALSIFNLNIISGGQKGVMYELCRGVFENRNNSVNKCSIIGILPSNGFKEGNEYLDVAIPTGSGALQNIIVPMSADLVIAVGGSAGTLAEISFAWQNKKPIGLIGKTGWANKLANQKLDNRRKECMNHFSTIPDLISWVERTLNILNKENNV